ncbi:hypothetical protein [Rickettsia bellii]|uniref:Putative ubiquinone/menaquinone biosynthesis methyltransferase n=2 Tax=Rickettsia bellii TaxID=33990 RepID=A0A0F3QJJ8_RICBE|nr:hypothetical protein [Rickettsia bellii]ABV79661.1 ubiquinone/menaquinone biosynthesis methyltransferase [Rickettsia bellii OSU 85-389]KJV90444.1 putative ubiquinone/menaquinone biosynthesis methyltransferase [Rickettsia bellii str. RML An4]KJV92331.1 putative ubiquinone/menaquinone biosynthesis methyltransferase [Rickettsia bellii str. RML Mogi]
METTYSTDDTKSKKGFESAFGIWKDMKLDSLEYQAKLRDEWILDELENNIYTANK